VNSKRRTLAALPVLLRTLFIAAMLLLAVNARAELRCDCTQVVDSCSASVSLQDMDVEIESNTNACSRVDYLIDGQPYATLVVGGKAALPWQGQPQRNAQIVVENCRVCADRNDSLQQAAVGTQATDVNTDEQNREASSIVKVMPNYPRDAWTNNLEGDVTVEFSVNQQGIVQNIKIISASHPVFVTDTMDAISRFRFTPALENGEPAVASGIREQFRFRLPGDSDPVVTSSGS